MRTMSRILAVMTVSLVVGACAPTTISPNWGKAYQEARTKQILNPTAGEQLDTVEGQDGKVSATAMEAYRKGFEKPDADFNKSVVTSGVQTK
ncbi:MAG TPA: hypothetical protein VLD60_14330 [Nitrospira sp.]|nr:hypothetical protein [Nitrospira sp.]